MQQLGQDLGFEVTVQDLITEPTGRRWSSSWARELLQRGEADEVAAISGRSHTGSGIVVRGFKRGRELGFPTANLGDDTDGFSRGAGVWAGWLIRCAGPPLAAASAVGPNPRFENIERSVEAYVLDRDDLDLCAEYVVFECTKRLRGNTKFDRIDALIKQMTADVEQARVALGVASKS